MGQSTNGNTTWRSEKRRCWHNYRIDVHSMRAEDIKPNRLERAKQAISRLDLINWENDRIGLIVFAGRAYVQLPITTDFAAAKLFLNINWIDMIPAHRNIHYVCNRTCPNFICRKRSKHKALIIITDGENHEDDLKKPPKKQRKKVSLFILSDLAHRRSSYSGLPNGVQGIFFQGSRRQYSADET